MPFNEPDPNQSAIWKVTVDDPVPGDAQVDGFIASGVPTGVPVTRLVPDCLERVEESVSDEVRRRVEESAGLGIQLDAP
jgi:hypothetical protein